MNTLAAIAGLWLVCGAACAALVTRAIQDLKLPSTLAVSHIHWPPVLRLLLGPARLATALLGNRLPSGYRATVRRRLEKADLHPGVDPSQWTGLCLSAATASGILGGAIAILLPVPFFVPGIAAMVLAWLSCERWLQNRITGCERSIVRELPSHLDLLTVCVEAGATLTAAARFIVEQAPDGPLRHYFERVLREIRSGRVRSQAFVSVADSYGVECLSTLASALSHAESAGMSIGQVLRTQAEQRSMERFVRAERQAMQAPVKMLGPLIFCIFPCTFVVLAVPVAHRLMEAFQQ